MRMMLIGAVLSALPLSVSAADGLTVLELQAQIQALMAEISAVQLELQVAETNRVPQSPACPQFSRSLKKGMSGNDVRHLQSFLMRTDDFPEGETTAYFGVKTENAVRSFQCRELGICSVGQGGYGVVGPRTRETIARLCSAGYLSSHSADADQDQGGAQILTPVCGQPAVPVCAEGLSCTTQLPAAKTYTNDDAREADNAVLLHAGACVCGDNGIACQSASNKTCSFWGRTIPHGVSVAGFRQGRVASLALCESESRSCENGTLTGSYSYATCEAY